MTEFQFDSLKYGDKIILEDVSFMVNPGRVTVIAGESGSGKSTLFRAVCEEEKVSVSSCGQEPLFTEELTLRSHFDLMKELYHYEADPESEIKMLGLEEVLEKKPNQLSGGEKKRAAFLLSSLHDAELYVFDEPTASVNEEYFTAYLSVIERLKKENKAVLIFTHDSFLMGKADIFYRIEKKKLVLEREDSEEAFDEKIHQPHSADDSGLYEWYVKIHAGRKTYLKYIEAILFVCIALSGILFGMSRLTSKALRQQASEIVSDEMTVFHQPAGMFSEDVMDYYSIYREAPLRDEEIQEISSIPHVESMEWRYDTELPDMSEDTEGTITESDDFGTYSFRVYDQNGLLKEIRPETKGTTLMTYLSDHKHEAFIDLDFGVENGLYISRGYAEFLKDELGLSDDSMLEGLSLSYDYPVPVYNSIGRSVFVNGTTGEQTESYSRVIEMDTLTQPIAGILKASSFSVYVSNRKYCVYVERSAIEELIEKHRASSDRILCYTKDWEETIFYDTDAVQDLSGYSAVFYDYVFRPVSYSVFADNVENIGDIRENLKEAGYSVLCGIRDTSAFQKGLKSLNRMYLYGSILLALIILAGTFGICRIMRTAHCHTNQCMRAMGLSEDQIKESWKNYRIKHTLHRIVVSAIVLSVFFLLYSLAYRSVLLPPIISYLLPAVLCVMAYFVIPQICL